MTIEERFERSNKSAKKHIIRKIIVSSLAAGGFFSFPSIYLLILLTTPPKNTAGVLVGYVLLAILAPIYIFGIRVMIIEARSVVGLSAKRVTSATVSIQKRLRFGRYKVELLLMHQNHEGKKSREDRQKQKKQKLVQNEVKYSFCCKDPVCLNKNNSDGEFKVGDTVSLILSSPKFEPYDILYGFIDDGTSEELVRKMGTQQNKPLSFPAVFTAMLALSVIVLLLIFALFYLLFIKYRL